MQSVSLPHQHNSLFSKISSKHSGYVAVAWTSCSAGSWAGLLMTVDEPTYGLQYLPVAVLLSLSERRNKEPSLKSGKKEKDLMVLIQATVRDYMYPQSTKGQTTKYPLMCTQIFWRQKLWALQKPSNWPLDHLEHSMQPSKYSFVELTLMGM